MKKYLSFLLVPALLLTLTACPQDPDPIDDLSSSNLESILKNYGWLSDTSYDFSTWGDDELSFSRGYLILYFLGDGEGVMKVYNHES